MEINLSIFNDPQIKGLKIEVEFYQNVVVPNRSEAGPFPIRVPSPQPPSSPAAGDDSDMDKTLVEAEKTLNGADTIELDVSDATTPPPTLSPIQDRQYLPFERRSSGTPRPSPGERNVIPFQYPTMDEIQLARGMKFANAPKKVNPYKVLPENNEIAVGRLSFPSPATRLMNFKNNN